MSEFSSYQLRKWSVMTRFRDRVCQICGSREKLEAHHIFSKSYFPHLAYDLDNGIALCGDDKKDGKDCHSTFHNLYMKGTRKKCEAADLERFTNLYQWAVA